MKLGIYRLPDQAQAGTAQPSPAMSAWWVRFGDEVVVGSEDAQWSGILQHARESGTIPREHPRSVDKNHLHVVVQNGRLFQQEHPDVPVILDRGRFLLVELDPEQARLLEGKSATCYGVLPLREDQVVFDVRDRTAERAAPVDWIQDLVDKVVGPAVQADLVHLVSFPTRYSTSAHYANAAA